MSGQHKTRQAATVILLRPAEPNGFGVFRRRRPHGMAFLGGIYCFPGGALRKDDCSAAMLRLCHGLSPVDARKIVGAQFSPPDALGLWIGGIRELFEETGVLLAVDNFGQPWNAEENNLADKDPDMAQETCTYRALVETGEILCDA